MLDAYMHLDLTHTTPLEAWETCWAGAGLDYALQVETWGGGDYALMERVPQRQGLWRAFCLRQQGADELDAVFARRDVLALRVRAADLARPDLPLSRMADQKLVLLVSAEAGTSDLADALEAVHQNEPRLRLYVPHLGWPPVGGAADAEWRAAMTRIAALPQVTLGISAISHFSGAPHPHEDVGERAKWLCALAGPQRITIATDYPHMPKARYAEYLALANGWAREVFGPQWVPVRLQRNADGGAQ